MPRLTLPRLVIALTFIAIFAMAARVSADTDTWWHLRTGQWIVEHGAIPQTDPFSHTRLGADWRIPGWVMQVPLYGLYALLGYAGLNLFTAALVTLTFVLVYPTCTGHPLLRAFTLVLAATASGIYWSARPHLLSLVLTAAFALVLYRWRHSPDRGWRRLLSLPALMALWANGHGGFAIGFILIALTGLGEGLKALGVGWVARRLPTARATLWEAMRPVLVLAGMGLACAAAVALNPAGPEMLLYPFKTVSIGALREFIQEWQSPNFHAVEQQPFLWLLLATFGAVALSRRAVDLTDLVLVGGTAYMGFLAGRNMPLLAVVAPALLTRHAAHVLSEVFPARPPFEGRLGLNWLLLGVLTLVAALKVLTVLPAALNEKELARTMPLQAAAYLRTAQPPGPMFNSYNFGGYLMWAAQPAYPVYVDGRTDLYDDAFLREYLNVAFGRPGYASVLERHHIRLVVVEAESLLGDRLQADPAWQTLYRDEVAAIYGRTP